MAGSAGRGLAAALAILVVPPAAAPAGIPGDGLREDYPRLVERYRGGDVEAAEDLASALLAGGPVPTGPCRGWEGCEAAAVLNLHAAALLLRDRWEERADEVVGATHSLVDRLAASFAFDWRLAAAAFHQSHADHARAFLLYVQALGTRPRDARALLGRATTLEFSAVPDGFGGHLVSSREIWPLLAGRGEPPPDLPLLLASPQADAPYRRLLLEHLTRQYRHVLETDPPPVEARLRLGRVLAERGRREEAEGELRAAAASGDAFLAAVARLCLACFETSAEGEAAAYRSALDVDPALRPAWLGLGRALFVAGDRAGAVAAVERALTPEEGPPTAWVSYHLGLGRTFPAALDALRARVAGPR